MAGFPEEFTLSVIALGVLQRCKQRLGTMGMDNNTLQAMLGTMEQEAEAALAADAAFFEALRALKWEIDIDPRVRLAYRKLRERGIRVFSSFTPRVRVRLRAGATVLATPERHGAPNFPDAENFELSPTGDDAITQELRDAASAVIAASACCHELDVIVNEAVHAHAAFERVALAVERAGYELTICLDLSAYAQVVGPSGAMPELPEEQAAPEDSGFRGQFSSRDVQFLKQLHIKAE